MRPVLIITALFSEARPLIARLGLKSSNRSIADERFQAFRGGGICIAVSGMGRMRSAITASALLSGELHSAETIVVNLGICGASPETGDVGTLFLVNKVTDCTSGLRFYPDVLIRHSLPEASLETHEKPVIEVPSKGTLVDMEGAGFVQAASMFTSPSQMLLLKVISDYCGDSATPQQVTPALATHLIAKQVEPILTIIEKWQNELPTAPQLEDHEKLLLANVITHAHFTRSEQLELMRLARSAKARDDLSLSAIERSLSHTVTCRREGREIFQRIVSEIVGDSLP